VLLLRLRGVHSWVLHWRTGGLLLRPGFSEPLFDHHSAIPNQTSVAASVARIRKHPRQDHGDLSTYRTRITADERTEIECTRVSGRSAPNSAQSRWGEKLELHHVQPFGVAVGMCRDSIKYNH
jgi:hypothetical protein